MDVDNGEVEVVDGGGRQVQKAFFSGKVHRRHLLLLYCVSMEAR